LTPRPAAYPGGMARCVLYQDIVQGKFIQTPTFGAESAKSNDSALTWISGFPRECDNVFHARRGPRTPVPRCMAAGGSCRAAMAGLLQAAEPLAALDRYREIRPDRPHEAAEHAILSVGLAVFPAPMAGAGCGSSRHWRGSMRNMRNMRNMADNQGGRMMMNVVSCPLPAGRDPRRINGRHRCRSGAAQRSSRLAPFGRRLLCCLF